MPIRPEHREMTCRVCGCTDSHGCVAGCHWVTVDLAQGTGLCSECSARLYGPALREFVALVQAAAMEMQAEATHEPR